MEIVFIDEKKLLIFSKKLDLKISQIGNIDTGELTIALFYFFRYLSYLISYGIVQMCAWKFVMRLVGTFLKSMSNRQKIPQKPQIILPKSTGEFA